MSVVAAAVIGGAVVGAGASMYSGSKAASASKSAANTSANATMAATEMQLEFQREQLDYYKELDALPREYREAALTQLGDLYTGDGQNQQQFIDRAKNSPIYQAIMGNKKAGNDAIMANASATGGLRTGNTQRALYDSNINLENEALLTAYNDQIQGLSGLAGLPGYEREIGNTMGAMGTTSAAGIDASGQAIAQGQVASGQAWQQGIQGAGNAIQSGVGNYLWASGKGLV